jgi:hypothetical protein
MRSRKGGKKKLDVTWTEANHALCFILKNLMEHNLQRVSKVDQFTVLARKLHRILFEPNRKEFDQFK